MSTSRSAPATNHRILIVDDNPAIHEDFRRILSPSDFGEMELHRVESVIFGNEPQKTSRADYQLAFASQGEDAVMLVESAMEQGQPFAAAMVDVRMPPGMDGVQTIKQLWGVQRDLEIVICTAYSEYSWEEITDELGPSHRVVVLKKPFDPIEVLQLAQALTSKWGAEREAAFKQLDLQGRLLQGSERLVEACERLRVEQEERRRLEKSVREIQRTDSLARLAMGIAHDFNNLLTVIQGHLSIAIEDSGNSAATNDKLETVLVAARRATDLSRQLVSLSKETDGRVRPVNLSEHLKSEIDVLECSLGELYPLTMNLEDGLPAVFSEPASLTHLTTNLVLNARESMPGGGRITLAAHRVEIRSDEEARAIHPESRPGTFVQLAVSDVGRGYSKDEIASIFDADNGKKAHRMGLAVVRSLAHEWGGWAMVRSAEGVGSEFSVFLNVAHSLSAPPLEVSPLDSDPVGPSMILVVDDDRAVRELVVFLLKRHGHEALSAGTADEGWRLWSENRHQIRLLVTDIQLPGSTTGFDLAAAIHEEDVTVPVIFMSGFCPDLLSSPQELTIGVDFIPKPFDVLDLMNAVGARLSECYSKPTFSPLSHSSPSGSVRSRTLAVTESAF